MKRCDSLPHALSDDRLLQLADCRQSLMLTNQLLNGTPNSVTIGWIQSRLLGGGICHDEHKILKIGQYLILMKWKAYKHGTKVFGHPLQAQRPLTER